jgi:hypothetical protein
MQSNSWNLVITYSNTEKVFDQTKMMTSAADPTNEKHTNKEKKMFGFAARRAPYLTRFSAIGLGVAGLAGSRSQCSKSSDLRDESLNVYLSPESRGMLASHLDKLGVKSPVNYDIDKAHVLGRDVVLKAKLSDIDDYVYSPLYGERAAFRLKGIITTAEGEVIGTGRVANLTGELFDEEYEASVILKTLSPASKSSQERRDFLSDLPTRLYQSNTVGTLKEGSSPWKGSIPGGTVLDRVYSATSGVTIRTLSKYEQLVVDGRVCSSNHADPEEGTCSFDRSEVVNQVPPPELQKRTLKMNNHKNVEDLKKRRNAQQQVESTAEVQPAPASSSSSSSSSSSKDEDAEETCPVCRYMKGGPCRSEFIAWDACIQGLSDGEDIKKCYEVTATMMTCMQEHEYYDPMTANQQRPPPPTA